MKTPNFLRGEFIGKKVRVEHTPLEGIIIDETKSTLTLQTTTGRRRIVKKNHIITFLTSEKEITIKGSALVARPEDRIKTRKKQ